MKNRIRFLAAVLVLAATPGHAEVFGNAGPAGVGADDVDLVQRRNVLLVIADDLGVDKVQRYIDYHENHDPITELDVPVTPTIDNLADSGVTFVNAWSSPTDSPTLAGMYTGKHAFRHGIFMTISGAWSSNNLDSSQTTLAEILNPVGYDSGLFGKWHLGETVGPLQQGWSRHVGTLVGQLPSYFSWRKLDYELTADRSLGGSGRTDVDGDSTVVTTSASLVTNYATSESVDDALDWINSRTGRWMATVSFHAPHTVPYDEDGAKALQGPPASCHVTSDVTAGQKVRLNNDDRYAYYKAMVECLDTELGRLLDGIPDSELERTTIIFVGDNGIDERLSGHFPDGRGKGSMYEGGINVPLIIADGYVYENEQSAPRLGSSPGRVTDPGRFSTAIVQTIDLFATVAEIAGADASSGVDSNSLVPLLNDTASSVRDFAYVEIRKSGVREVAIRDGYYKLIGKDCGSASPTQELYVLNGGLVGDRWEQDDLVPDDLVGDAAAAYVSLLDDIDALLGETDSCR